MSNIATTDTPLERTTVELITALSKNGITFKDDVTPDKQKAFAQGLIHHFSNFEYTVNSAQPHYILNPELTPAQTQKFIAAIARNAASAYKQQVGKNLCITAENIVEVGACMKEFGVRAFIGADAYTFSDDFANKTNYGPAQQYCGIIDILRQLTDIKKFINKTSWLAKKEILLNMAVN